MDDMTRQAKRLDPTAASFAVHPALQHDAAQGETQVLLGLVPAMGHPMGQQHALPNLGRRQAAKSSIRAGAQQGFAIRLTQLTWMSHALSMTVHSFPPKHAQHWPPPTKNSGPERLTVAFLSNHNTK